MVIVSVIAIIVAINCLIFLSLARTAGRADRELKNSTMHFSLVRRKMWVRNSIITNESVNKASNNKSCIDEDLKSCMKCRLFWGNNHRCANKRCDKEKETPKTQNIELKIECKGCTYKQSAGYCFPCMKKLLGRK